MKLEKPNCYLCKHRGDLSFDAHSCCNHPKIDEGDKIMGVVGLAIGLKTPIQKRLNVSGHPHGIKNGWFMWPVNFDPVWLETCDGYEGKVI